MSHHWKTHYWPKHLRTAFLLSLVILGTSTSVRAQENSLSLVPRDAYFYQASLRGGEQWQAIVKSKAWAKLHALPAVKMAWQKFEAEWANPAGPLAMVRNWYEQEDNRQLVQLLGQMFAEESFIYGGRDAIEFGRLLQDVQVANQLAPLAMLAKGGLEAASDPQARIRFILQTLAKNPERLKAPDVVIGFKLADPKLAEKQLKRLEDLAQALPPVQAVLKKIKIGENQFLSLQVDGQMVPWNFLPIRNFEEKAGDFDPLMKKLPQLKLSITLGLRDRYLLLNIGESTAPLENLGKGQLLVDHPDLHPLKKFPQRRIHNISYVSKECQTVLMPTRKDLEETFRWAVDLLKDAGLTAQQEAKLRADLKVLAGDLSSKLPKPGSILSFSMASAHGQESYTFDRSGNSLLDGSKPLPILNHLGGSPLFFAGARAKHQPEDYDTLVKYLKLAHQYFEELGVPKLPPEAQQQYEQVMKIARPLLDRLHKTTGKSLLPALANGQHAFLLDAKLASKQWHKDMPPSAKPLPLPEFALVIGVSDPALLRQAMEEYREILNDIIAEVHKASPGVPDIKVPAPNTLKVDKGTLYFYPLPEMAGLDKRLVPTAGLSNYVLVLALSHEHADRLLTPTPLQNLGRPLTQRKDSLAAVVHLDWAGLVQAFTPWVDYGLQLGGQDDDVRDQVLAVLQILQVLRSHTSVTFQEDGVTITHSETIIRDLE